MIYFHVPKIPSGSLLVSDVSSLSGPQVSILCLDGASEAPRSGPAREEGAKTETGGRIRRGAGDLRGAVRRGAPGVILRGQCAG